jgi:predicted nucleotidyltransferase
MNVEMLKKSGRIIFETVSGSHAYGTNVSTSDTDIRGFYVNPSSEYLGLSEPSGQISDEKNDITYYSLKNAFELLQKANPNMIELLWMPEDCVRIKNPIMDKLIANRDLFISKKCFHSHSGYAYAQIQKARGSNKKVHNPQPEERPKKEDFCWIIPEFSFDGTRMHEAKALPSRPIPLKELSEFPKLSWCHCSALEHVQNTYRLYLYGGNAKGVFRGDDMLVCESIPLEDECKKFIGLLVYNQHEYEKAVKEWHSYHDWLKNRNESRWVDQEKGKLNYDQKNLMHCIRLLLSGENILTNGFPLVRFEGEQRDYLMKIRSGEFKYEELMAEVEKRMANLEELYKTSTIPHSVNMNKIEELYRELSNEY